jgi:large subunit ribosomal protein L16
MLQPKKMKFTKTFRGKILGNDTKVIELAFGNIGIKALQPFRMKANQLEALRKALLKKIKGKGKIWIRLFPNLPVTAKPLEVRMGKGKGNISYWCSPINAGRILLELQGIPLSLNKEILKISRYKLPISVKLIYL